jgi:hypothetical protein
MAMISMRCLKTCRVLLVKHESYSKGRAVNGSIFCEHLHLSGAARNKLEGTLSQSACIRRRNLQDCARLFGET